jgi:hypothetical protein
MAYEKRPNSGTLGKNQRKTEDKHPEYAGEINVDGRDYWLSGWVKTNGQTGDKFFSLSVKPKEPDKKGAGTAKPSSLEPLEPDDDLPWGK